MIITFNDYLKTAPRIIRGKVENESTGKAVEKALIYISKGNDEVFSGSSGEFDLKTWQDYPITLTVEHPGYQTGSVTLDKSSTLIRIRLIKK